MSKKTLTAEEAFEAVGWAQKLHELNKAVDAAKITHSIHKTKCKHWTTIDKTDGATGSIFTVCEWCGEEV